MGSKVSSAKAAEKGKQNWIKRNVKVAIRNVQQLAQKEIKLAKILAQMRADFAAIWKQEEIEKNQIYRKLYRNKIFSSKLEHKTKQGNSVTQELYQ